MKYLYKKNVVQSQRCTTFSVFDSLYLFQFIFQKSCQNS